MSNVCKDFQLYWTSVSLYRKTKKKVWLGNLKAMAGKSDKTGALARNFLENLEEAA